MPSTQLPCRPRARNAVRARSRPATRRRSVPTFGVRCPHSSAGQDRTPHPMGCRPPPWATRAYTSASKRPRSVARNDRSRPSRSNPAADRTAQDARVVRFNPGLNTSEPARSDSPGASESRRPGGVAPRASRRHDPVPDADDTGLWSKHEHHEPHRAVVADGVDRQTHTFVIVDARPLTFDEGATGVWRVHPRHGRSRWDAGVGARFGDARKIIHPPATQLDHPVRQLRTRVLDHVTRLRVGVTVQRLSHRPGTAE